MLLTRFWFVVVGLVLGSTLFVLSMAQSMYNRAGDRARGEGLSADSQVVSSFLKDDARARSGQLIKFALDGDIAKTLGQASKSGSKLPDEYREKVTKALKKVNATIASKDAFDAVFAIDQHGRVVGHIGYPQANGMSDFELGGYPVVADALHGFIRDDTLVWGRVYRVVARPVQVESGQLPAGAIVGARVLDDRFARELSSRTGAAVAFYVGGSRTASGVPEGFVKSNLDHIVSDLEALASDPDYVEKGRSGIRDVGQSLSVQYTKLPGEAYVLGAGVAVARVSNRMETPLSFFQNADDVDKAAGDKILAGGVILAVIFLGLMFSFLEHSVPLKKFKREASKLASGETDQLQPSRFRGVYRKIAVELNEGIDKVAAATGGQARRATNLEDVLGALPAQPQMTAFSVPEAEAFETPGQTELKAAGHSPEAVSAPVAAPMPTPAVKPGLPTAPRKLPPTPGKSPSPKAMPSPGQAPSAVQAAAPQPVAPPAVDPEADWRAVYEQFVKTKKECGESTDGFTFEKFRRTLVKNRDSLIARHGVSKVKFAVHVKAGKAALKASPIKN